MVTSLNRTHVLLLNERVSHILLLHAVNECVSHILLLHAVNERVSHILLPHAVNERVSHILLLHAVNECLSSVTCVPNKDITDLHYHDKHTCIKTST